MRSLMLAACLFVVGCGGVEPVGPEADAGTSKDAQATFACNPGEWFCEGTKVWTCTHEGHDAVIVRDCGQLQPGGFCGSPQCPKGSTTVIGGQSIDCCAP